MIDKNALVKQAELELRQTRAISAATCQSWETLPAEVKTAFAQALAFLGCTPARTSGSPCSTTAESDRVAAARLMLLKLGLDSDDPKWSSDVLDRLLKAATQTPAGSVSDLFAALFGVLGDFSTELSKPVAGFIKDFVVRCFTRCRQSYDATDWERLVQGLADSATKAQLYLALHAVPPQFVSPPLTDAITQGLAVTAFREEAASTLAG